MKCSWPSLLDRKQRCIFEGGVRRNRHRRSVASLASLKASDFHQSAGEPAYDSAMASYDDVTNITNGLAGVERGERYGTGTWKIGKAVFAWERPFSKADIKRFGAATPPSGPILAVSVADLDDKEAVLAEGHSGVFTISHFDGYAALLIQMDVVSTEVLGELVVDAWMTSAPRSAVDEYLARNLAGSSGSADDDDAVDTRVADIDWRTR
jgi:hypothetical protein